jgi:primase-polymerase (primpol)-like protein
MRECGYCGKSIVRKNAQARYCSDKCRNYDRRRKAKSVIPNNLISTDRWVRRAADKRPLTITGTAASSTNPATWSSYSEAVKSTAGVGLGFVLGDGIGCIDLDHCLIDGKPNEVATKFLSAYPSHHIEVSPSLDGLHIWGTAEASRGSRKTIDGLDVERYSTGRYITITGNVYQHGELLPL